MTAVLDANQFEVLSASVATWPDGAALESFLVRDLGWEHRPRPDAAALEEAIVEAFRRPMRSRPGPDAVLNFDDDASPWYTLCTVEAPDRGGLLHDIAAGFAVADVSVHSAQIETRGGRAIDRFEVTDHNNRKLDQRLKDAAVAAIAEGVDTTTRDLQRGDRRRLRLRR